MTVQVDRDVDVVPTGVDVDVDGDGDGAGEKWSPPVEVVEPLDYSDARDLGAQIAAGAAKSRPQPQHG